MVASLRSTYATVDAMRKEFGEWVEANEGHAPHAERLDALARKHGRNSPFRPPVIQLENLDVNRTAASLAKMDFASTSKEARRLEDQKREERRAPWGTSSTFPQNQTNTENRTNLERNPVRDYAAVAKQVREWSFKFDGSSKPLEFLEQVEWSAETYGLDLNLVPRAIPELLKGTALKWYIANNEHWRTVCPAVSKRQPHRANAAGRGIRGTRTGQRKAPTTYSAKPFPVNGDRGFTTTAREHPMHSMRRERQGSAAANAKGILRISNTRAQSYTGVQEMWT
ncbi:hypothetical protein ACLKA6_002997 [Drosophila palustris]